MHLRIIGKNSHFPGGGLLPLALPYLCHWYIQLFWGEFKFEKFMKII